MTRPALRTERDCSFCKRTTTWDLRVAVAASGAKQVGWRCETCKHRMPDMKGRMWIPHGDLSAQKIDIEALPHDGHGELMRCSRCGVRGSELHHWAPKAVFHDDAETWPKDYLCLSCHNLWRDTMLAAGAKL